MNKRLVRIRLDILTRYFGTLLIFWFASVGHFIAVNYISWLFFNSEISSHFPFCQKKFSALKVSDWDFLTLKSLFSGVINITDSKLFRNQFDTTRHFAEESCWSCAWRTTLAPQIIILSPELLWLTKSYYASPVYH